MKLKIGYFFASLAFFGIVFLYSPITSAIDNALLSVRNQIIHQLEQQIGRNISFKRILPFLSQGIEIENFTLTNLRGREILKVNRLVLKYNLAALLFQNGFPIDTILLQNAEITLDEAEDKDIIDQIIDLLSRKAGLPPITVVGEQVDVSLAFEEFDVVFNDLSFRFDNLLEYFDFTLTGKMTGTIENELPLKNFRSQVVSQGRFDPAFQDANLEIQLENFDSNLFSLKTQSFRITKLESKYKIRTINNAQPYDLEVGFNPDQAYWSIIFYGERVRPSNVLTLKQEPRDWRPLLNSQFSGRITAEKSENLTYEAVGTLDVPNLPNWGRIFLEFEAAGVDTSVDVKRTSIKSNDSEFRFQGRIDWADLVKIDGELAISRWLSPLNYPYSGKVTLKTSGVETFLRGTIKDEITNSELSFNGQVVQDTSFLALNLKSEGFLNLETQSTYFPATNVYSGSLTISDLSMKDVIRQTNQQDVLVLSLLESWYADLQFDFLVSDQRRVLSLSYLKARDSGNPVRFFELNGQVNNQDFNIILKQLSLESYDIKAFLFGSFNPKGLSIKADIDVNGYSYSGNLIEDTAENSWKLISDDVTLLTLTQVDQVAHLTWDIERVSLPLGPFAFLLTTNGSLEWNNKINSIDNLNTFFLLESEQFYNIRRFRLETYLHSESTNDFLIEKISLGDTLSSYTGSGYIRYQSLQNLNLDLDLLSNEGGQILLDFQFLNDTLSSSGVIKGFELKRFFPANFSGLLDSQFLFRYDGSGLISRGLVSVKNGKFGNDPFTAEVKYTLKENQFRVYESSLTLGSLNLEPVLVELDLNRGNVQFQTSARSYFNNIPWSTQIKANIETGEEIILGNNFLGLERITGSILLDNIIYDNKKQNDFLLTFSKIRNITTLRGGENSFLLGRVTDEGDFRFVLNKPFPMTASIEGRLQNAIIDAKVQNLSTQSELINLFISPSLVKMIKGTIEANLTVRGFVTDPTFEGSLNIKDTLAETSVFKGMIGPFNSSILFEGNRLELQRTTINVGSGSVELEGIIFLTRLIPERYQLNLFIDNNTPIGIDYVFSIVRLSGFVSGELALKGSLISADISGDLELYDSSILIGADSNQESTKQTFPINIDLIVRSGNRVSLIWPLLEFPVIRAYISPKQALHYQSDSFKNEFKLYGDVDIRGGEIFYFGQVFYLRQGNVSFREDQIKFDPFVILTGEYRTRDNAGPVTVFLEINDFLSRFTPRFSSSPPKTSEEISALVGSIFVPDRYTKEGWQGAINLVGDVGSGFVLRPFEDAIRSTLGLDMFSVRTQLLNRILQNQFVNENQTLQDYLDNTSIFLGKYIDEDIFFEGLFTLTNQSDEYNPLSSELKPRLELGLELQTPFVLIRWQFVPETPSKLFIPDNTINLNWRWTY